VTSSRKARRGAIPPDAIELQEIADCICLRLRRTARQMTQIYDRELARVGLTVNQFGLLARLYGSSLNGRSRISIGALAEIIGMHPTTLNRNLKPLISQSLITYAPAARDQRVRAVEITAKGRARLGKAAPFWRRAEAQVRKALGARAALALNRSLDFASAKITI